MLKNKLKIGNMKYSVVRTRTIAEYTEVSANSEEEAIKLAQKLDEDKWECNPNDDYLCWDYNVDEVNE